MDRRGFLALLLGAGVAAAAYAAYRLLGAAWPAATPESPVTPSGSRRVSWRYVGGMGAGINVNWVSFDWEARLYDASVCRDFAEAGFRHVRLRVPLEELGERLSLVQRIVNDCTGLGVRVVVAGGHKGLVENPTPENVESFVAAWRRLSEALRETPVDLVSYNLVIEAGKELGRRPDVLNEAQLRAWRAIRGNRDEHVVFFAPPYTDDPLHLHDLRLPEGDEAVAAEFHFCAAGPSPKSTRCRWTTGTPEEKRAILERLEAAVEWRRETGTPVWMGAWMPCSYNKGCLLSIEEQVRFTTFLKCALLENHVPDAVNADAQFYDMRARRWRSDRLPVLQAVLHPRCEHPG